MILYQAIAGSTEGIRHSEDLPVAVVRSNADGSKEVVAKFHSPLYARECARLLNDQVSIVNESRIDEIPAPGKG